MNILQAGKLRLYSNSSLTDYRDCRRLFFYKYILEWAPDGKAVALIFGDCWHKAQDAIWTHMFQGAPRDTCIMEGFRAFKETWAAYKMPTEPGYEEEKELAPRTLARAMEMVVAYVESRQQFMLRGDLELLDVEQPFAVPLDPEDASLFYVGKIDKVVRASKVRGIEHKTTTAYRKDGPFRSHYIDHFHLDSQIDGYLFALHMQYPGDVEGVWVDAALVHKVEEGFQFIPVERQMPALDLWLWSTRETIRDLESHWRAAMAADEKDRYLAAFPMNTNSCFNFNSMCPFFHICRAMPNPLGKPIPTGFSHRPWDPLEHINAGRLKFDAVQD